jgi:epoxyqueuosine reductase
VDLRAAITEKAVHLGLDALGIVESCPVPPDHARALVAWLGAGYAGPMGFMQRHLEERLHPGRLLPGARCVIAVGISYKPKTIPARPQQDGVGCVACYALFEDYHAFLKTRLHELASYIQSLVGGQAAYKVCVDSAPLLERAIACRAGLGFIGRNHMLIHPGLGPQIFLGELITTVDLETDGPATGDCGDCDRCMRACPTGALRPDGFLDAGRCINTLTIEQTEEIPPDLASRIGDRVYGCDECVTACPVQAQAPAATNPALRFHPEWAWLDLHEILAMTPDAFAARFAGSPILRIGVDRLQRNARVCLRNEANRKQEARNER